MGKAFDLTGQVFNRLTVLGRVGTSKNGSAVWLCRCICGNTKEATTAHLKGGYIQSCGCLHIQRSSENGFKSRTHGARARLKQCKYSRLYRVWCNMKDRCENPNSHAYENYGGRGIAVCKEWHDFTVFKEWAIKSGYKVDAPYGECTLDRKENNKGYSPDNCRWVTMKDQAHNRRNGHRKNGQFAKVGELEVGTNE